MKPLYLAALVYGQISLVHAEIVMQAGQQRHVFADTKNDSPMVNGFTQYAEQQNRARELRRQREQIKDEMGLGELERMAVSGTEPKEEDVLKYRGADTDQLFALLKKEDFAHNWLIVARTIGMVADEEAAKKLAAFAITAFPRNSASRKWHVKAREGAMWGLTLATRDQPMPWVREFLVSHADADQWTKDFGENEIDPAVAYDLALKTMQAISRMANKDSLAMLRDVRERQASRSSVQPASVEATTPGRSEKLDHIDILIKQTQQLAEQQAEHAEKAL